MRGFFVSRAYLMPSSQPALFNVQEFTDAGVTLAGGRLYTYAYGTTAFKAAYTDPEGSVPRKLR